MNSFSISLSARCRRVLLACLWLALGGFVGPATARAYTLEGSRWPLNKPVVMYLQLGNPPGTLTDGSTSWNAVAESALAIWNPCLGSGVQFSVATAATSNVRGDHNNSVFFSDTAFGSSFGDDTLAITIWSTSGPLFTESDVIVNTAFSFDSYRGPRGSNPSYDLRRVMLHEFGHVLGLGHASQSTVAVMRPVISEIDTLEADDIAGVQSLYGAVGGTRPVITSTLGVSAAAGQAFQYRITASNAPIGYFASGLPSELQVNTSTGIIYGTLSIYPGTYNVALTAVNAAGSATATLVLTIPSPPAITSPTSISVPPGQSFSYQITATGSPTSFSATGYGGSALPSGITVNTTTGLVTGTMGEGGAEVTVGATGPYGTGRAVVQFNPAPAPPIIDGVYNFLGPASGRAYAGSYCGFGIVTRRHPTSFTATGLPSGVSIDPSSGQILGTPTATGTYTVTLTAANALGMDTYVWTLSVGQTIAVTSGGITGKVGTPITYQVTASPMPTSFRLINTYSSAGLSIDPATGVITGTPAMSTVGSIIVSMSNDTDAGSVEIPVNIEPYYISGFFHNERSVPGNDSVYGGVYMLDGYSYGHSFGYYTYLSQDRHYLYHFDMGYEYVFDAADGGGAYFYDFKSSTFFYTSPTFAFPYMYDFTLDSVVYYYPDPNPNHYPRYNTDGVRYLYVFNTGQIISK